MILPIQYDIIIIREEINMKCTKCGSEIQEGASFCTVCGMPIMGQTSTMTNNQNDMTSNVQNNTINSSNEVPNLFDNQDSGNTQMYNQTQNSSLNYQNSMANNQLLRLDEESHLLD